MTGPGRCGPAPRRLPPLPADHNAVERQRRDLPPLHVATCRERISGGVNQGRARDATREEVHGRLDELFEPFFGLDSVNSHENHFLAASTKHGCDIKHL